MQSLKIVLLFQNLSPGMLNGFGLPTATRTQFFAGIKFTISAMAGLHVLLMNSIALFGKFQPLLVTYGTKLTYTDLQQHVNIPSVSPTMGVSQLLHPMLGLCMDTLYPQMLSHLTGIF
jgi:hypothetical protein